MTDLELLQLAAKAYGLELISYQHGKLNVRFSGEKNNFHWNPLADDGDALRLAAKLDMLVDFSSEEGWIDIMEHNSRCERIKESYENGVMPAIRRAILRSAAEIGKTMK